MKKSICAAVAVAAIGCASPGDGGLVQLSETPTAGGCTNVIPAAALRQRGIKFEVANLAIQEVTLGKVGGEYQTTVQKLLADDTLNTWVRNEMVCRAAAAFETTDEKVWYLAFKEVAAKATAGELMQWLRENPYAAARKQGEDRLQVTPAVSSGVAPSADRPGVLQYGGIWGEVVIPPGGPARITVTSVGTGGVLVVPGDQTVDVGSCFGTIKQSPRARVEITHVGSDCRQTLLPDPPRE